MKPAPQNKDKRSPQAATYRAWYSTPEWKNLRRLHVKKEPYCRFCAEAGLKVPVHSVDHIRRHRGQHQLFFDPGNLQSLCEPCHNSTKQREEALGYSTKVGPDGLPTDPNHPFNRG